MRAWKPAGRLRRRRRRRRARQRGEARGRRREQQRARDRGAVGALRAQELLAVRPEERGVQAQVVRVAEVVRRILGKA